ncbi:tetratricopeptide repeat protein [Eisenibacter elegans]|jgi:hypothetical protein|uniref:tetratricopeptide repeat protein n=1 Tax=Eisenibacter elegans TaxID=997 RepID=UPI0006842903|nr:tetratricopeptide repeat protein [Eisenibacter elegans]
MQKKVLSYTFALVLAFVIPLTSWAQRNRNNDAPSADEIRRIAIEHIKQYYQSLNSLKDDTLALSKEEASTETGSLYSGISYKDRFIANFLDGDDIYLANDLYPYFAKMPEGSDRATQAWIYMNRLNTEYPQGVRFQVDDFKPGEVRLNETSFEKFYHVKIDVTRTLMGTYRDGNKINNTERLDIYVKVSQDYNKVWQKARIFAIDWARGNASEKAKLSKNEEIALAIRAFYSEQYEVAFTILSKYLGAENNKRNDDRAVRTDGMAAFALAWMYWRGQGGAEQSDERTIEFLEYAGKQDNVLALLNLGWIYYFGYGADEDEKKAYDYFQKAGRKGHPEAQYYVGMMSENGQGTRQNERRARRWYRKAAAQNYGLAIEGLARLGEGPEEE